MSLQVEIHQDFPQPLSQVFADLADHEKLGRILGAPMTRLVDGSGEGGVNGLGSVRRVGPRSSASRRRSSAGRRTSSSSTR